MTLNTTKNVLTLKEMCNYTGLSSSYVYQLTCGNKIPYFKPLGKRIYFKLSDVEEFLMQNPATTSKEKNKKAVEYLTIKKRGGSNA